MESATSRHSGSRLQADGAVRMGPGTLYGTLNRLVDDKLIEETTDRVSRDDNERRRYYQLTASGRAVAVEELVRLAHWWKFLTGGAGVLVAVVVLTTVTGEVDDGMWWPMVITVVGAFLLLATGLVLGIVRLTGNHPHNAPS